MPNVVMYGLVSDQAAANLLPAMQLKPDALVLFYSQTNKKWIEKANVLHDLLKSRAIPVTLVPFDNDTDFEHVKDQIIDFLAQAPEDQSHIFNVTGGNKFMAMALIDASSAIDDDKREVIYLDIDNGKITRLDKKQEQRLIDVKISIKDYLTSYGINIEKTGQTHPNWQAEEINAFENIARNIERFQPAMTSLNAIAAKAEENKLKAKLEHPNPALNELIDLFADLGKLSITADIVSFSSLDDLNYVKGGWLEHFVFQGIADVQKELGITDKYNSVEFTRNNDKDLRNEIDSLFMHNNHVYVVECKTTKMKGELGKSKANDQLHKLANLALNVGGLGTKSAFVSFQNLGEFEKRLAKQMGIRVIHGQDLKDLKGALKSWIKN